MSDDPLAAALERGLRFNHALEMQTWHRVADLSASLNALLEMLLSSGALPFEEYRQRREEARRREERRTRSAALVVINDVPDKYALGELTQIDCQARLSLCRGRCCSYPVLLSAQDLDERILDWDYGRPYRLRQRPDGSCVHQSQSGCSVYQHRPAVCRQYDCRNEKRIWIDFERRIPAP